MSIGNVNIFEITGGLWYTANKAFDRKGEIGMKKLFAAAVLFLLLSGCGGTVSDGGGSADQAALFELPLVHGEYPVTAGEETPPQDVADWILAGPELLPIGHNAARIAAGCDVTAVIKQDGSAEVASGWWDGDPSQWRGMVSVSAGFHIAGLKADGTVLAAGPAGWFPNWGDYGQCEGVSDWREIASISAGSWHTVGLKRDGTVLAAGLNSYGECSVSDWRGIVAVSAGRAHTVGLKADGTVVAAGGYSGGHACDVTEWKEIAAVSAGGYHTVGLKTDGTVVVTGAFYDMEYDLSDWRGIIAVSAGERHVMGLKSDGTVVMAGEVANAEGDVSGWSDVVEISAGHPVAAGLLEDGTAVILKGYVEWD